VLRYLLMPGPSPTPKPRAKARPTPTANTTTQTPLRRLGLGRASGLAPRSMIIVFCPFTVGKAVVPTSGCLYPRAPCGRVEG
jgi:hypothetical protein